MCICTHIILQRHQLLNKDSRSACSCERIGFGQDHDDATQRTPDLRILLCDCQRCHCCVSSRLRDVVLAEFEKETHATDRSSTWQRQNWQNRTAWRIRHTTTRTGNSNDHPLALRSRHPTRTTGRRHKRLTDKCGVEKVLSPSRQQSHPHTFRQLQPSTSRIRPRTAAAKTIEAALRIRKHCASPECYCMCNMLGPAHQHRTTNHNDFCCPAALAS